MKSVEKIYGLVANYGKISFETIVHTGTKSASEMRLDDVYYKDYKSEKYANLDTLDELDVKYKIYASLIYRGRDEDDKYHQEEVWMNPGNFDNFKNFLTSSYEEITNKANEIYGKGGKVNPEYEDFIIETGLDENGNGYGFVSSNGQTVFIYPTQIINENGKSSYPGIALCIENSNGEQYGQTMGLDAFFNFMNTITQDYNMLIDGRQLYITSVLYQLADGGTGSVRTTSSGGSFTPRKSLNNTKKPIKKRQTLSEALKGRASSTSDDNIEEVETEEVVNEENENISTKKTISKSEPKTIKKVVKKSTSKVSVEDILNEADDIDLDFDDGEELF